MSGEHLNRERARYLDQLVWMLHENGHSWGTIAKAFDVTRSRAQQRYRRHAHRIEGMRHAADRAGMYLDPLLASNESCLAALDAIAELSETSTCKHSESAVE